MLPKSKGTKYFPMVIVERSHFTNNKSTNSDDNMDVDSYDDDVSDASDDDYREEGEGSRSRIRIQKDQEDQEDHEDQEDQEDHEDQEDPIPDFTMLGRRGNRRPKAQLDKVDDLLPAGIFRTFFNEAILKIIVQNTNAY